MTATLTTVRVDLPFATQRYRLTSVELVAGRLGADARELFSFGYCHYLTSAVHEATGWRLAVMQMPAVPAGRWRWVHTAAYAGHSSQLLDVGGVQEREQIAVRYSSYLGYGLFRWASMGWADFVQVIGLTGAQPSWWRSTRLGWAAGPVIDSYVAQLTGTRPAEAGCEAQ
jgi:hypothetical protein